MTVRECSWTVAVHVLSFVLLTAAAFRINQAALFLRWDGLLHLVEDRVQHVWGGPPHVLNLDLLMANGELSFPNFYALNPALVVARWAGHGEPVVWLASTLLVTIYFIAAVFLGRSVGFSVGLALAGAWLSCLLTLPYVVPVVGYIRLWGNQPLLAGIASQLVALGVFFRLGRRGPWMSVTQVALIFALLAYAAAFLPFVFVIGAPVVMFFALVAMASAESRSELRAKIIATLVVAIALLPLAAFVVELHSYSKVPFFRHELYTLPMTVRDVSFFVHVHEEAGLRGAAIFLAAVTTAGVVAWRETGPLRRLARGYLLFMGSLMAAALAIAMIAGDWWGPPMAYIDMVALPFTGMFSAVLLAAAGRWVLRRSSLAGSLTSLRFARKPLGIAVALAVLPWLCLPVSFAMAAVPTLVRSHPWPWPMRKTPLVADLEREIGLTPGALFRGRVANLAGARGIYPASHPPFNNQHAYDHGFISAVGNDHRSLGFWSYSIPTLNTSSQFTTPFFHLVVTRFLNEPHSLSVRAHETATRFEPRILAMLGTRLVIHDSMIASGATLRHEYHVAGRTLYLHEVADPNLGTYSPTITHVVTSAKDAITLMTRSDVQFRREAIVHAPLPDSLVEARSEGLRVFRDALRVEATSAGTSLLVLPLEYSHCLVFDLRTPDPGRLRVVRVNVNQTGLVFERALSGDVRLRFGAFVNQGCRFQDLADAKALRVGEAEGWWPEAPMTGQGRERG